MHRIPMMRTQAGANAGEIDLAMPARAPRVRWTFTSLAQHTDRFAEERAATGDSAREYRPSTRVEPDEESRPAIVCGVDDSNEARRALDATVDLARRLDVRPVIVRVGQAPMLRERESAELSSVGCRLQPAAGRRIQSRVRNASGVAGPRGQGDRRHADRRRLSCAWPHSNGLAG